MSAEKYGFIYVWRDRKHKRYYIGSHWGTEDDGYICSSRMMKQSYLRRPSDFKRRIVSRVYTNRQDLFEEEQRWLDMIDPHKTAKHLKTNEERKTHLRYYNLDLCVLRNAWYQCDEKRLTVGEKISRAKKGKSTGPCSEETKAKISKANTGKVRTKEMNEANRQRCIGRKRSEESKRKTSESLKKKWAEDIASGKRKVKQPKQTMSLEEQSKRSSNRLKEL